MDEFLSIAVLFVFGFLLFVLLLLVWAVFFTINH